MEIKHKIAMIFGGTDIVSKEIAKTLTDESATVILVNRAIESTRDIIQKTLEKYWHIDILINVIESGTNDTVEKIDVEKYKTTATENIDDVLSPMQIMIPMMRNRSGGAIVNVAMHASAGYAVRGLSLAAHVACAKDDIVISTLRPKIENSQIGDPKKVAEKIAGLIKNEFAEAEI